MSYSWRTKADVLDDLGSLNGRRTGATHLDRHVVEGERPPPIHREAPDEDEMSYFYGRHGGPSENTTEPDLAGISVMLKMVRNMDDPEDDEPMTLYHNRATDQIRISKLNPLAGEYVPGGGIVPSPDKPKRYSKANEHVSSYQDIKPLPSMFRRRSEKKAEGTSSHLEQHTSVNQSPKKNVLRNHISQMKSDLLMNGLPQQKRDDFESADDLSRTNLKIATKDSSEVKPKSPTDEFPTGHGDESQVKSIPTRTEMTPSKNVSHSKPNLLSNGLPKRKIEKTPVSEIENSSNSLGNVTDKRDEIREIQEKVKSTIIASSNDNSIHTKRQKNVAIATLLKLGSLPPATQENTVKLIKPEYFENPPERESQSKNEVEKEHMSTSSSSEADLYIDPDSISKVDTWFKKMESPKPKPQLPEPPVLKPSVAFKKRANTGVNSPSSDSSKETIEPKKEVEKKAFKPSSHASDLLKKYESKAERAVTLKEDLGSMLERMLKEKDEIIKQKMLARQNAG